MHAPKKLIIISSFEAHISILHSIFLHSVSIHSPWLPPERLCSADECSKKGWKKEKVCTEGKSKPSIIIRCFQKKGAIMVLSDLCLFSTWEPFLCLLLYIFFEIMIWSSGGLAAPCGLGICSNVQINVLGTCWDIPAGRHEFTPDWTLQEKKERT